MGIKVSGQILAEILVRHGFNIRDYTEYPSLIRGGHNTYQISFSHDKLFTIRRTVDLFFSLAPGHWQEHESEFTSKTGVFGEDGYNSFPLTGLSAPLKSKLYNNTICLGALSHLIGLDTSICKEVIQKKFGADSPNNQAFDIGSEFAAANFADKCLHAFKNIDEQIKSQKIYEGNEAFGWGFIRGKGSLYAAYPMSPSSGTLHFLAGKQTEFGFQVIHPEDEIAAASLATGAAFTGARVAVGTSGGGFALMTETVSLCGAAHLGVVFYLVSRPGPATGLPTWTGQGDLLFAVNSGHGEFNKIVLAPGDQQESFVLGVEALNLAARFNVPVIVLSDKFIAESSASLPDLSTQNSEIITVSRVLPGTPGQEYMANSYEQTPDTYATEKADEVRQSVERRLAQLEEIKSAVPAPELFGNGSTLIVSFGSTRSTVLETIDQSQYSYLQIKSLYPLHPETEKIIKKYQKIILVENNARAQLGQLLKSNFDFHPAATILKYDGRPFFPEELQDKLTKIQ